MKRQAFLIGPFIGSYRWEYFHFAPYIIHLKKRFSRDKFIIFTRPQNFDLYGIYADVFVPLRINEKNTNCFKKEDITGDVFNKLLGAFINKFKTRYKIREIVYPDVTSFYYKVKWQFPRSKMDYDFIPRKQNKELIKRLFHKQKDIVLVDDSVTDVELNTNDYFVKTTFDLTCQVTNLISGVRNTTLGCFIEAIKRSEFVVGDIDGDISRLALLLQKPLIIVNGNSTEDEIHLLNPLKTPVIKCSSIEEGINIYEDNFRP
jgi:hypothetical protein